MAVKVKSLGVALVGLLGVAALGTGLAPASAQSGSRICGSYWKGVGTDADGRSVELHYARAVEVPKLDASSAVTAPALCAAAKDATDHNHAMDSVPNWQALTNVSWEDRGAITFETCEDFGSNEAGGFYGDDPCNSMNRYDALLESISGYEFAWKVVAGEKTIP